MPAVLKPIAKPSRVTAAGYDADTRTLSVQFKDSTHVYHYKDVPPDVYAQFEAAESKGTFLAAHVTRKFDFAKVDAAAAST